MLCSAAASCGPPGRRAQGHIITSAARASGPAAQRLRALRGIRDIGRQQLPQRAEVATDRSVKTRGVHHQRRSSHGKRQQSDFVSKFVPDFLEGR